MTNKDNLNNESIDVVAIYQNYIHAILAREEFGNRYGDSDELIKMFEEILSNLQIKPLTLNREKMKREKR